MFGARSGFLARWSGRVSLLFSRDANAKLVRRGVALLFVGIALLTSGPAMFGAEAPANESIEAKRARAEKRFQEQNWNDALVLYRELAWNEKNVGKPAADDLQQAVVCVNNLGRIDEADELLEKAIAAHADDWRVLWMAANVYANQIQHDGFIVSGEFRRGPHRGGGEWAMALGRDRGRALQLLVQAMPSAKEADDKQAVAEFYLTLASAMTAYNGAAEAWRLQHLTDVAELPDYERQWYYANQGVGAPVDAEGNVIYFRTPKSWEEATNDGERWRWAMEQAVEVDPDRRVQVLFDQAVFYEQMYGVSTLARGGFRPLIAGREGDDENESGTYALHTLKDDETIAYLATGVKRFTLPDEFNPIRLYETVEKANSPSYSENAANALGTTYLNRRQYPRAAEWWKTSIEKYGPGGGDYKKRQLSDIVDPWGMFEPFSVQPAGTKATFEFRFRNGDQVDFVAKRVDAKKLLDDVKAHLKASGERVDWEKLDISDIGRRLINQGEAGKYATQEVAKWSEKLEPRPQHFDERVTIESPLAEAGAYLITAKMKDGNTCYVLLWIADSAIVKKPLDASKNLYFCADAVTGEPLPNVKLDFFGYKQEHLGNGRFRTVTSQFAETTDENGMVVPDPRDLKTEYAWLVTLIGDDQTRFAYMGYDSVWESQYVDMQYNEVKAYLITDRPVYRPEQTVHFKAWLRKAQYDNEGSDFAGADVELRINDPQGNEVWKKTVKADAYGGVEASFDLAGDATLGEWYLNVTNLRPRDGLFASGGGTFRVEEYKKPEFEVKVEAPDAPVMLGEKVTGKIEAKYYFGAPVVNATVKYKILRTEHDERWYPWAPWDWCFGRGYWWFASDYPWYPGWHKWVGCIAPPPWWWYDGQNGPPEVVADVEVPIGEDGVVEFEIDTLLAKETMGDSDHKYSVEVEVRDQSRRTIMGTGQILVARKPFEVYTWLEQGYYRTGDVVHARLKARTIADKPVKGEAAATLYQIAYDTKGEPIETPVRSWKFDVDEEGDAKLDFRASASGQYRFACDVDDGKGHTVSGGYIFTIIGEDFDGADFRYNAIELIPDKADYAPGDTVRLQVNADQPNATILLFVKPSNSVYLPPQLLKLDGKSTVVDIPVEKKDMPNFFVEAVTISGAQDHSVAKEIVVPPEKRILNVEVLPSEEAYKPGEKAKVKIHLTDFSGENFQGTTVVSIYDKSLEYISGGGNTEDIKEFFWKWRRTHQPYEAGSLDKSSYNLVADYTQAMQFLGLFGAGVVEEVTTLEGMDVARKPQRAMAKFARGDAMARGFAASGPMAPMAATPMAMETASAAPADALSLADGAAVPGSAVGAGGGLGGFGEGGANGQAAPMVQPTVRTNFADLALWRGALTTDATGVAEVELDMPENLTAWKIKVWGMGHGTRVGSGEAEVVTRKDLLVRMQAPRFFIQTDEVVLSANVHNYLATAKRVEVALELPNEELVALNEADLKRTVEVPSNGEARVDWRVKVVREGTAKVRMLALTDEESDAMEMTFPCYVHGFEKMEAWAGTVRPEDQSEKFTINVPEDRRPEESILQVRYSPTLAGAMVDALPYLAEYPYGCTEQTLNRFVPSVVTRKTLLEMGVDLAQIKEKRANLNAQEIGDATVRAAQWQRFDRNPVFDPEELDRMVKEGVKALANMQCADGGWGWFSGYGEQSWPHTTAVVVNGLMRARESDVALPDGMLERGIEWLATYEAEQIAKLQRNDRKEDFGKPFADNLDSLIYMLLTQNGRENETMRNYLFRDREHLAVYAKATFGLGLEQIGDKEKLDLILQNISQFLVQDDENETAYLRLPADNWWWFWYGSETEANAYYLKLLARTDGKGQAAPRLVKYLLNNRKHATYWNSTRDTALCVEAFAEYLAKSDEMRPDMTVQVLFDGEVKKSVEINANTLFAYDDRFLLEGVAVPAGSHDIEIRRTGKGPVYWNAYLTNFTLEDFITKAGLEVKVERAYYKLVPEEASVIAPGERGQVLDRKVEKFRREPLKTGDQVDSGDLLEIELTIDSKNDYEYLVFEDSKAAGCEPVDVQSGYKNDGMHAYVEFRDEKVSFFVRQLARGTHSVKYRVRAEIPGKFSALPAVGQAMYAPELRGNSDEMKLGIVDKE